MPLDKAMTEEELDILETDLHTMSILFRRGVKMPENELDAYCDDLTHYIGVTYSFTDLIEAIRLARQHFNDPGEVIPKPKFIMDRIHQKA